MDCLLVCFHYVHDLVAQYKLYTSIVVFNLKPNFDLMFFQPIYGDILCHFEDFSWTNMGST